MNISMWQLPGWVASRSTYASISTVPSQHCWIHLAVTLCKYTAVMSAETICLWLSYNTQCNHFKYALLHYCEASTVDHSWLESLNAYWRGFPVHVRNTRTSHVTALIDHLVKLSWIAIHSRAALCIIVCHISWHHLVWLSYNALCHSEPCQVCAVTLQVNYHSYGTFSNSVPQCTF